MSLRAKLMLPEEMRSEIARVAPPTRATRRARRPDPRRAGSYRQGFVLGLCVGTSLALVLGLAAFLVTRPRAAAPAPGAAPAATEAAQPQQQQAQAIVDVTARHVGNLRVQIDVQISAPVSYDPITMGQVAVYTDMVAMPMSHRQGPIMMAELSERKGVYQAVTTLPMIGEYDIMVELKQPMAATAHKRLTIASLAAS